MDESGIPLRRSQLGTPANEWDLIEAAVQSNTDEVFLDLEDSLAPSEKRSARSTLIDAADAYDWSTTGLSYRINAVHTRWWYEDVIGVVEAVGDAVDNVIVPKVTGPSDVVSVVDLLRQVEVNAGLDVGSIGVSVQIENASSMNEISAIVRASDRLTAVVFGPADYATSIGATRNPAEPSTIGVSRRFTNAESIYTICSLRRSVSAIDALKSDASLSHLTRPDGERSYFSSGARVNQYQ